MRDTNARLQENLQKSTSELDNLSKRFDKSNVRESNSDIESNINQRQEIIEMRIKLDRAESENKSLREEV